MSSLPESRYKSILVKNNSCESTVFLNVYFRNDPICWITYASKSIPPGKMYLYRSSSLFKYEIRAQKDKRRRIILAPIKWKEDKLYQVTDSDGVEEDDLSKHSFDHRICVRRNNMQDENSGDYGRNLYGILRLDMKEVRRKPAEEQDDIIRKAYRRQMLLFHPDRNPDLPDSQLCQEITMAYSILGDREKRALYHDLTDYRAGWSKFSAIFKPQAHGKNEKWKRIGLLAFSFLTLAGGVVLTALTGGLAAPVVIGCSTAGAAMIGAGFLGGQRVVSYDTIANGANVKKFLQSMAIGAVSGAVAGAATAGITAAMVGIGTSALSTAEITLTEAVQCGAATNCVNGAVAMAASDADRAFVDKEEVGWGELGCHVLAGGLFGAATGAAGGAAAKAIHVAASAATVEGEVAEQGFNRFVTKAAVKHASKVGKFIEKTGTKSLRTGLEVVEEKLAQQPSASVSSRTDGWELNNHEDLVKKAIFDLYDQSRIHFSSPDEDQPKVIRYVCKASCEVKMVVHYADENKSWKKNEIAEKSTHVVPEGAKNIIVGFKYKRLGSWCDVNKYNRFTEKWCVPTEPHVFWFDSPVSYTFTLDSYFLGGLYVAKITDGDYQETDVM